ncbi:MAG: ATP synthase F1 subunit delta [Enterobacteriaceae bacterium]
MIKNENYISKIYAKCIFSILKKKKKTFFYYKILILLSYIAKIKNSEFLFSSKNIKYKKLNNFLIKELSNIADDFFLNLIKITLKYEHFCIFPSIFNYFVKIDNKYKNIKKVKIISSCYMNRSQLKKICKFIKNKFNFKPKIKLSINKSIISGFIIKFKNITINNSIKSRIYNIKNFMSKL